MHCLCDFLNLVCGPKVRFHCTTSEAIIVLTLIFPGRKPSSKKNTHNSAGAEPTKPPARTATGRKQERQTATAASTTIIDHPQFRLNYYDKLCLSRFSPTALFSFFCLFQTSLSWENLVSFLVGWSPWRHPLVEGEKSWAAQKKKSHQFNVLHTALGSSRSPIEWKVYQIYCSLSFGASLEARARHRLTFQFMLGRSWLLCYLACSRRVCLLEKCGRVAKDKDKIVLWD